MSKTGVTPGAEPGLDLVRGATLRGRVRGWWWIALVCGSAAAVMIAGCGGSSQPSCVKVPQNIPPRALAQDGGQITVPSGTVVFAALVESMNLSGNANGGFPWQTPRSSNPNVLLPVRLCPSKRVTSLPVSITGFRAVGPGAATLTAPLTSAWNALKRKPAPYQAVVVVVPAVHHRAPNAAPVRTIETG